MKSFKAIICGILASCSTMSMALTIYVPTMKPTIQAAIDAAVSGDKIEIVPGTYTENIDFKGKNIEIKSFNTAFPVVIKGTGTGPVVKFSGTEPASATLRNVTITGGKNANGAGIFGNGTLASLRNVTVSLNEATGQGGGIYDFDGLIQNCTITQNKAAFGGGLSRCDGVINNVKIQYNEATANGGGLHDCNGTIQNSTISNNSATVAGGGLASCNANITLNKIQNNDVTSAGTQDSPVGKGAGLFDCNGTITKNLIKGNISAGRGGGMDSCNGIVQNNIINKNTARWGGGVANGEGRFENNTVYENMANFIGGGCYDMGTSVTNTIIFMNTAGSSAPQWHGTNVPTYSCVQNWTGGQPDIITLGPQFKNPSKDNFTLNSNSPCIDAGQAIPDLVDDYYGVARPLQVYNPPIGGDGSGYDIGATEYEVEYIDLVASFDINKTKIKYKGVQPNIKGGNLKAVALISHTGNVPVNTPFSSIIYLSADGTFDPSDIQIGKTKFLKKLKAGKSKKMNAKFKILPNTPLTGQYLIAVVDTDGVVTDSNTSNNIAVFGPLP